MAASDPEKLLLRAWLLRGGHGGRGGVIRGEELLLLLRHKLCYEEWEGATSYPDPERDVQVARSMAEAAEAERATLRTLAEARAWAAPAASLRGATR